MNNKVSGLLGIAARARKVATGDSVMAAIRQNKAKLVLLCADCGSNAQKKIQDKCRFYGVDWIVEGTAEELSAALGQPDGSHVRFWTRDWPGLFRMQL